MTCNYYIANLDYYYDINVCVVSLVPIQSELRYTCGRSACKKVPV